MPAIEIDDDTHQALIRLCTHLGRSHNTVIIFALEALERERGPSGTPTTPKPENRAVARPAAVSAASDPRPDGSRSSSLRYLHNGPHLFEVVDCSISADEKVKTGSITLIHAVRKEIYTLPVTREALVGIADLEAMRTGTKPATETSQLIGAQVTLICYGGEPYKLPNGKRLSI